MRDERRWPRCGPPFLLALALSCGHTDEHVFAPPVVGPFGAVSSTQLTFNVEQDYWPAWTEDGQGILYAFVEAGAPGHRCIGLLPAAGGSRLWQLCDNRATRDDSVSSYTAFALSHDGRLLYSEAIAPRRRPDSIPTSITLWLGDTAAPYRRTALLTDASYPLHDNSWLAELRWTGPASFLALAQSLSVSRPFFPPKDRPLKCAFSADSGWSSGGVLRGVIADDRATVEAIPGTTGASGYALSADGASLIIIRDGSPQLFRVPIAGGAAVPVATIPESTGTLLGLSCRDTRCIVASDAVILPPGDCAGPTPGVRQLWGVDLATGVTQLLMSSASALLVGPSISPVTGDVVLQIGGQMGRLGTNASPSNGNLHLIAGLVR